MNGPSRYSHSGKLTERQYLVLDLLNRKGPLDGPRIADEVWRGNYKTARRLLHRWRDKDLIRVAGKVGYVPHQRYTYEVTAFGMKALSEEIGVS